MATTPLRPEIDRIEQDYKRNVAVLEARPKLEQGILFVWLLVDIGLILYFLITVVLYTISGSFTEARQIATVAQNAGDGRAASVARAADPLLLGDVRVLQHAVNSYDLYATIENTNTEWYATISYTFLDDGLSINPREATIMPGETQYALGLAVESSKRPSGAQLVISDVQWSRVDRHQIASTENFLADRMNIVVGESIYATDVALEKDTVGRSIFTLTNASAYSYYEPTAIVLLKRAGSIVAINTVEVPQLLAGETREVEIHWFGTIPTSSTVEVALDINYFDPDAYMGPESKKQGDIRDRAVSN